MAFVSALRVCVCFYGILNLNFKIFDSSRISVIAIFSAQLISAQVFSAGLPLGKLCFDAY